jgi:hypothetical protein
MARMRVSGPGSATMHESPAGVAQSAEQPSCNGFNEPDLTCEQARIADEIWRAFAVLELLHPVPAAVWLPRKAGASLARVPVEAFTREGDQAMRMIATYPAAEH